MNLLLPFLIPLFLISLAFNLYCALRLAKKPKRRISYSMELREYIADQLNGGFALISVAQDGEVRHIPDSDYQLRSPRQK